MNKIGIVSKIDHCKPHKSALESMGFEVLLLGSDPTSIPETVEAVVVRTQSISHGGDRCARLWSKSSGRPIIYENGLTGIIRRFSKMKDVAIPTVNLSPFSESGDSSVMPRYLSVEKFKSSFERVRGDISSVPESVVSGIRSFTSSGDPKNFSGLLPELLKLVSPHFKYHGDPVSAFVFLYMLSSPGFTPYLSDLRKIYFSFTGKECNHSFPKFVAWHMGFPSPIPSPHRFKVTSPVPAYQDLPELEPELGDSDSEAPSSASDSEAPSSESGTEVGAKPTFPGLDAPSPPLQPDRISEIEKSLSSNTDTILEVMIEIEKLRKTVEHLSGMVKGFEDRNSVAVSNPCPDLGGISIIRDKLRQAGFKGQLTLEI